VDTVRAWLALGLSAAVCACGSGDGAPEGGAVDGAADTLGSGADTGPQDSRADAGGEVDPDADAGGFVAPPLLSSTGLYADLPSGTLAAGVTPYDVRYPLWSDGAEKKRYLYLPAGATIDTSDMDSWRFPVGTKAWKEFSVAGKRIETRILEKRVEGEGADAWALVAYLWRDDGSDADAVPAGVTGVGGTTYDVPDSPTCVQCHGGVRDVLIGVSAFQLSAADGHGALSKLAADGRLSVAPPAGEFQVPGTGVVQAALGYLHGNCGHCHNDTSFLSKLRAMRLRLRVADTTPESTPTYTTTINAPMSHTWPSGPTVAIAPGDPKASQLLFRMSTDVGTGYRMPPVATKVVDDAGVATIRDWILALPP